MQQQQVQNLLTTWRPIHRTRIVEHKRGLQAENLHPNRPDEVLRAPTSLASSRNPDSRELTKINGELDLPVHRNTGYITLFDTSNKGKYLVCQELLCFQRQLSVRLSIEYSATRKLRKLLIFPIWGKGLQISIETRDFPSQVPLRLHTVYCSPVTAHRLLFTGCRYPFGGKSARRS